MGVARDVAGNSIMEKRRGRGIDVADLTAKDRDEKRLPKAGHERQKRTRRKEGRVFADKGNVACFHAAIHGRERRQGKALKYVARQISGAGKFAQMHLDKCRIDGDRVACAVWCVERQIFEHALDYGV